MKLIFLHIPKAAGTTFHAVLDRLYPAEVIFDIKSRTFDADVKRFIALPEEAKSKIQLLKGHIEYGYHRHFNNEPVRYITFLRDPVKRIVSHYNYVLSTPVHYLHKEVTGRKMTLEQYATSDLTSELDNSQVRWISGVQGVNINACTEEMLETAFRNLTTDFAGFGLAEYFDESLVLFRKKLNWEIFPAYRKLNIGKENKVVLDERIAAIIRERNILDEKLYRRAEVKFLEEVKTQAGFNEDLNALRTYNSWLKEEYESGFSAGSSKGYHSGYAKGTDDVFERHVVLRLLKKLKNSVRK